MQRTLFVLDFSDICSLFLVANDESILHNDNIQKQKLQNLLKISSNNIFSDSHNPDRVIFNFSSYELTDDEKKVSCKALNNKEILNENSKFSKVDIPAGKEINHIVNLEEKFTSDFKLLKDKEIIDKSTYKSIKLVCSRPNILYGSGKIHKETCNRLPSFRPIISAIDTPSYKLAKF